MEINSLSNRKNMYYQEALLQKSLRLSYVLSHVYKAVIYTAFHPQGGVMRSDISPS